MAEKDLIRITIRNLVLIVVLVIWSMTAVASVVSQNNVPLGVVSPIMMIIVAFLFRISTGGSN